MKHGRLFNRHSVAGIISPPVPGVETPGYLRLPLRGIFDASSAAERLGDGSRGFQPAVENPQLPCRGATFELYAAIFRSRSSTEMKLPRLEYSNSICSGCPGIIGCVDALRSKAWMPVFSSTEASRTPYAFRSGAARRSSIGKASAFVPA